MRSVRRELDRRARRLRSQRGVTDVPLELLIIVIILAIVVPIIVAALVAYTTEQEALSAKEQALDLRDVAVQAYDDGINTTLLVTLTMPTNAQLKVGGPLFLAGGYLNYNSAFIDYSVGSASPTLVQVDNGAENIFLTNVTCSGAWPHVTFNYYSWPINAGTTQLALTKIAPGAFLCGVPAPTNETAGFIEVQAVP